METKLSTSAVTVIGSESDFWTPNTVEERTRTSINDIAASAAIFADNFTWLPPFVVAFPLWEKID